MAVITPSLAVRNALLNVIKTAIDAGAGPGLVDLYSGAKPAGPDSVITSQVKLGTMTCSDPCGSVANGELTFAAFTQDSSADATGTATWARIKDSTGLAALDIDVGTIGGTAAMQMNTVNIVQTGPISISSGVIRA